MAKADKDLDLDTEDTGKNKTNLLIIILIAVILLVGGGVAAVFILGGDDADKAANNDSAEAAMAVKENAIYTELRPTFVINFEETKHARYLQIDLSVMSRDQKSIDLIHEHSPVIRNNIITILSGQKFLEINTKEGKKKLQEAILQSVNSTIAQELSSTPSPEGDGEKKMAADAEANKYVEAIYFTSFVMQ